MGIPGVGQPLGNFVEISAEILEFDAGGGGNHTGFLPGVVFAKGCESLFFVLWGGGVFGVGFMWVVANLGVSSCDAAGLLEAPKPRNNKSSRKVTKK